MHPCTSGCLSAAGELQLNFTDIAMQFICTVRNHYGQCSSTAIRIIDHASQCNAGA